MLIAYRQIISSVQCFVIDIASRFVSYAGSTVYSMSFVDSIKHEAKPVSIFRRPRKITTMFRRG